VKVRGGAAVAKGGAGCVFRPALACSDGEPRARGGVSKMSWKNLSAKEEKNMITLQDALEEHVPDYEKYFVVPYQQCTPARLSLEDLEGVDANCGGVNGPLKQNQLDLNNYLRDYGIINMADGGVSFSDAYRPPGSEWSLPDVFGALCDLLQHGIVPLNHRAGILHFDIKENNIVYDGAFVRLIDWDRMQLVEDIGSETRTLKETMTLLGQPLAYALHSDSFKKQLRDYYYAAADVNNDTFTEKVLASVVRFHAEEEDKLMGAVLPGARVDDHFLRAHIRAVVDKFRARTGSGGGGDGDDDDEWVWDWDGYRELLRRNFDVYGWLVVVLTCYVNARTMFTAADADAVARNAELLAMFRHYLYTPDGLVEPYNIKAILEIVRNVAAFVAANAGRSPSKKQRR
jgi:hypothetical protein